jgi:hypothetical protein
MIGLFAVGGLPALILICLIAAYYRQGADDDFDDFA